MWGENSVKIEQLQAVLEVTTAGSISAAAKNLKTNQPSVSRAVKSVENELDVILFKRTTDGIYLTNEGEKLLPHIWQVVQDWLKLAQIAHNTSVELCSEILDSVTELNIIISPVVLDSIIGPALERIDQTIPDIKPKIHLLDGVNPNELDKLPPFDLYIGHNIAHSLAHALEALKKKGRYVTETLFTDGFCLIVDKNHPLAMLESISKEEARLYPMILHDNGFSSNDFYQHYYETYKDMVVLFKSNNPRSIRDALHRTQAVFYTTNFLARRDYLLDEQLTALSVQDLQIEYFCLYQSNCINKCAFNEIFSVIKEICVLK